MMNTFSETMPIPRELLQSFPGHKHPSLLPKDVSLSFEMSEKNLFAIWFVTTPHQQKILDIHHPLIKQEWCLADPDVAFEQIQRFYGNNVLLAATSLAEISLMAQLLKPRGFWKNMISSDHIYFIEHEGKTFWHHEPLGKILFQGNLSDLYQVQEQGQHILEQKHYAQVTDARGTQDGHPKDWLMFMINAKNAQFLREERLKYLEQRAG